MNYACNCQTTSGKSVKYHITEVTSEEICVSCGHYAIFLPKNQTLRHINDMLFSKDIERVINEE